MGNAVNAKKHSIQLQEAKQKVKGTEASYVLVGETAMTGFGELLTRKVDMKTGCGGQAG